MPSFSLIPLENYRPLEIEAINLYIKSWRQLDKFYLILKGLALKGNKEAIDFRAKIRGNENIVDPVSIMEKLHYYKKIIKSQFFRAYKNRV